MKSTAFFVMTASLSACAPTAPQITVSDAWARATAPGQSSAAVYATIANRGAPDRLVAISSETGSAMLHTSSNADGVARMRMLSEIEIPQDKDVALAPGGTHIMLSGVRTRLAPGTNFPLTLRFAKAGEQTIKVAVVAAGAR